MKKLLSITLLTALLGLSGCSSTPTFSERVLAEGESKIGIANQWEEGNKDLIAGQKKVKKGEKLVKKGRDYVSDGEDLIEDGEDLIEAGQAKMKAAESQYQTK